MVPLVFVPLHRCLNVKHSIIAHVMDANYLAYDAYHSECICYYVRPYPPYKFPLTGLVRETGIARVRMSKNEHV